MGKCYFCYHILVVRSNHKFPSALKTTLQADSVALWFWFTAIPGEVDPLVGVWGNLSAPPGALGRRLGWDASVQQALFQQEDPRRLLETHHAGGADGGRVQVLQLPGLAAHFLGIGRRRQRDG